MNQVDSQRVSPLLTDFYQISMIYTYWKTGRHNTYAVFDLFYRTPSFGGQYQVFAGLGRVLDYLSGFDFTDEEMEYLESLPVCSHYEPEFFTWLKSLKMSIKVWAPEEGTLMFPRVPLLRVVGPVFLPQLIESACLNMTNFATQMATGACRMRWAAGPDVTLMEFGLRRAQGPDGAVSASHYAIMGGFDSTSNVLAGKLHDLPVGGTHAHSFVQGYSAEDLKTERYLKYKDGRPAVNFTALALDYQQKLKRHFASESNQGELASFIDYAWANRERFLALIDTYNVITSGLPNYLAVALALADLGYTPLGIRLDSGDLAHLSNVAFEGYELIQKEFPHDGFDFTKQCIVASNDIKESTLWDFRVQKHHITHYGIGTYLVNPPALGGVYKEVKIGERDVIKLSMDKVKMTIPGAKRAIRLYGKDGKAILDLMADDDEYDGLIESIKRGDEIFCRDPADEMKRCYVKPSRYKELHLLVFDGERINREKPVLEIKKYVQQQMREEMRDDHLRRENPTPYKVSVTDKVYQQMHGLMDTEAPINVLS